MRLIAITGLLAVSTFIAGVAHAITETDLLDTWHNAMPTNHHDKMLGDVTWTTITFSSNAVVNWTWTRDGNVETHQGKYQLPPQTVPEGHRDRWQVVIMPTTLAVRQSITLEDVTVQNDNRFPGIWKVLKWIDDSGNLITFVRKSDHDKWRAYRDLPNTANNTSEGIRRPADGLPKPSM